MDRRRFLSAGGFSLTAAFLAACNVDRSPRAQRLLDLAERKNEGVERSLFQHSSMNHARNTAKAAGSAFPSYFISKTVPVWDERVRGPWALEVSGLVSNPVKLSLEELRKLPFRSQRESGSGQGIDGRCLAQAAGLLQRFASSRDPLQAGSG